MVKKMVSIGDRLKEERKRVDLTQKELASHCGCSVKTQQRYESGKGNFNEQYLFKVAELGIDIGYVLNGQKTTFDAVETVSKNSLSLTDGLTLLSEHEDLMNLTIIISSTLLEVDGTIQPHKFKALLLMTKELLEDERYEENINELNGLLLKMARSMA